jgi:hypothetical protein
VNPADARNVIPGESGEFMNRNVMIYITLIYLMGLVNNVIIIYIILMMCVKYSIIIGTNKHRFLGGIRPIRN